MIDTYKDTTGSRKKFLIPLVVLLLCAVSLTGAGYAYNTSVTVNNQGVDVDDHFAIDLYTFADPAKVEDFADIDNTNGIVFTTHKVAGTSLNGDFELEAVAPVTIYKGTFKVNTPAEMDDSSSDAKVKLDNFTVAFADGNVYKAADVVGGAITAEMQVAADAGFTDGMDFGDDTFAYNTTYYYRIVVTAIAGTVTAKDLDAVTDATDKNAAVFAKNVIDADKGVEIQFGFTLTAYNPNTFAVTYHEKIGEAAAVTTGVVGLYTTGTALDLGTPTKVGYTFGGWFTNAECTGDAITSIAADATDDKAVYAKWTANTYQVVFNKNSDAATGTMAAQDMTYDVETALTANAFENEGYTFAGWATSADGAAVYTDGQTVRNLTDVKDGTVNLYAKWTENP